MCDITRAFLRHEKAVQLTCDSAAYLRSILPVHAFGVALVSRIDKIIGLF